MKASVMAFLRFWYAFIVGDDWSVAAAVIAALTVTCAVDTTSLPAWPVLPAAVAIVLPFSVWRVARRRQVR
jgi:hypothetical protein